MYTSVYLLVAQVQNRALDWLVLQEIVSNISIESHIANRKCHRNIAFDDNLYYLYKHVYEFIHFIRISSRFFYYSKLRAFHVLNILKRVHESKDDWHVSMGKHANTPISSTDQDIRIAKLCVFFS